MCGWCVVVFWTQASHGAGGAGGAGNAGQASEEAYRWKWKWQALAGMNWAAVLVSVVFVANTDTHPLAPSEIIHQRQQPAI